MRPERFVAASEQTPSSARDLLALAAASAGAPTFYWEHPTEELAILGIGVAHEIRARGRTRFADAAAQAKALLAEIRRLDPDANPLVVGGFGFAATDAPTAEWREFPAARLFVPEICWVLRDGRCRLTRVARGATRTPNASPRPPTATQPALASGDEPAAWRRRVEAASAQIREGSLTKVVLARRRALERDFAVDPSSILEFARHRRAQCFNFCVGFGETSFVGSSPERLVRLAGDHVVSGALAGSIRRGASADEDRRLGAELLASAKNAREHALVVDAVRESLRHVVRPLSVGTPPELVTFPESFHLFTRVAGTLVRPMSVIELAGLLHPTPAVCGTPRETAERLIQRDEPDRGWYGGTVGWMTADGSGEYTVAIRSALLDGPRVSLWAGAGIVEGSDPESELAETESKMRALDRALWPRKKDDEAAA